jgi:hypothetical protein
VDRLVEVAQLAARLDPELFNQRSPRRPIDVERLGLAARAIKAKHQLAARALAQRVFVHERLEFADERRVAAGSKVALDPLLKTAEPQLPQAGDLGPGEALGGEVRERGAAPEPERLLEPSLLLQSPEARQIELVGPHPQQVAGRLGLQALPAEQLAQLRDVHLQELVGRGRRRRTPNRVDQTVGRARLARSSDERSEQPLLFLGSERQLAGSATEFDRPKNADLDHAVSRHCRAAAKAGLYPD